jgi:hypothetical protein
VLLAIIGVFALVMCSGSNRSSDQSSSGANGTAQLASTGPWIAASVANCRAQPTKSAAVLARLPRGTSVTVAEESGGWSKLEQVPQECWTSSSLLTASPPGSLATAQSLIATNGMPLGNPAPSELSPVAAVPAARSNRQHAEASVYFRNCSEARAAGAAPIYEGQPGYASHLDRDGDGIACE